MVQRVSKKGAAGKSRSTKAGGRLKRRSKKAGDAPTPEAEEPHPPEPSEPESSGGSTYSQAHVEAAAETLHELNGASADAEPREVHAEPDEPPVDEALETAREWIRDGTEAAALLIDPLWRAEPEEVDALAKPLARVLRKYGLELERLPPEVALAGAVLAYMVPRMMAVRAMHKKKAAEREPAKRSDLRPATFGADQA